MKNELNEKLNWEVEQQELRIGDRRNKIKIALLRSDNGEILNVCSLNLQSVLLYFIKFSNNLILLLIIACSKVSS